MQRSTLTLALLLSSLPFAGFAACSATPDDNTFTGGTGNGSGGAGNGVGNGQGGGLITVGAGGGGGGSTVIETCEQAEAAKSYIGCDFWPTVVANNVWSVFDYAVVVANAGDTPADVTVTRGGNTVAQDSVPANGLKTIYLPWVPELKGPDADACGSATPLSSTVKLQNGAYHLVTSRPVTVYQFSALEYGPQGGPPGKDWSQCPASQCFNECFSYSNDASLLLPTTALTGNYRITGLGGWPAANISPYIAITGTQNSTSVTVSLTGSGVIQGGSGIPSANGGGQVTFTLAAGEVAEILGTPDTDLSGSLVQADKPVQVIHGLPCVNVPLPNGACDHIEESVFPAETLGERYFVTLPSGPEGTPVSHVVRIYGNVDNTALTYPSGMPGGAPSVINAGQVVDLGPVGQDFEIAGDNAFAVGMFQMGASLVGGNTDRGDPAQSLATAVEQYRTKYVFLAPMDYDVNYVDVVMPMEATVSVDGMAAGAPTPIGSGFGVAHIQLGPGNQGAHVLEASAPVGIQVLGYGSYTSYQYPGGSDLNVIAPPPGEVE